jgi:hypothetical protein
LLEKVMSLLVAAIEDNLIWMVSDTAVTGGTMQLRDREYQPKIEPSNNRMALVGFCGDVHHGTRLLRLACNQDSPATALAILLRGHLQYPETEFAYGYFDQTGPHLVRIADGSAVEALAMHIGIHHAFEELQRIRHSKEIDAAPKALKRLMGGVVGDQRVPDGLGATINSMLSLIPSWVDRDVGGWAIPYLLSNRGAAFFGHVFSVSDPIFDRIAPGSLVPAGTAEAGGFDISVTELDEGDGIVAYWLQREAGLVLLRSATGYDRHNFEGPPTRFKELIKTTLGRTAQLWLGDQAPGPIRCIQHMRDQSGNIAGTFADHGDSISFAVRNVETPFEFKGVMHLGPGAKGNANSDNTRGNLELILSDDARSVEVQTFVSGTISGKAILDAAEMDSLIARLGEIRSRMVDEVPKEIAPGSKLMMVLDPIWRTETPPHPGLNGLILRLRHPGFGWLVFLSPFHEAAAMGRWLVDSAIAHGGEGLASPRPVSDGLKPG